MPTNNSNLNIINFVMILGVFVFLTMGCQQINDAVNSNKATNSNTATNRNANSNATANSNAKVMSASSPTAEATPKPTNLAEAIVGRWEMNSNGKTVAFNFSADQKIESSVDGKIVSSGTYRIVDEKTIQTISANGGVTETLPIKIESNKMTMTYNSTDLHLTKK